MTDTPTAPAATVLTAAEVPAGCPTAGGALRVPGLLRHPGSGRLLLVHDLRPAPDASSAWQSSGGALPGDLPNPNSLWLRTSDDEGATWGAPRRLAPSQDVLPGIIGLSDPVLLVAPTGTLHLLAAACTDVGLFGAHVPTRPWQEGQEPEAGTLRLLHAASHDAGATWVWTDLTDLCLPSEVFARGCVLFPASGHGTATDAVASTGATGRLIVPVVAAEPATSAGDVLLRSLCLLSDDDGAGWFLGAPAPVAAAPGRSLAGGARTSGTDEHAVAALDDATVLMSARDGTYGGTRLTSVSTDGGATWSPAQREPEVPDPGCNAGLIALDGGRALLSHAADPVERRRGRLSLRTAEGRWQALGIVDEGPFGYSDLVQLPDGDVLVVWEVAGPDGGGTLRLRRLSLPGAADGGLSVVGG